MTNGPLNISAADTVTLGDPPGTGAGDNNNGSDLSEFCRSGQTLRTSISKALGYDLGRGALQTNSAELAAPSAEVQ